MNHRRLAQAALLILLSPRMGMGGIAIQEGAQTMTAVDELSPAQAQADFDTLRSALEEAHGGLYRFSTKAELDRRFDVYRGRLSRAVTRRAFIGLVAEMLADIRDGHARLEYDEATAAALAKARLFPLRVLIEGSRLMVLFNDSPDDSTIRPGMEILGINGRTAGDLLALLLPKMPGDGFIETGKKVRLGRTFSQSYWLFVDPAAEFTVTARDAAGKTVAATLLGVPVADRDKNDNPVNAQMKASANRLADPPENVSLWFTADPEIACLRIRSFDGDDYGASLEASFRTLHDKGTKALILDLRGNGGGVDEYGALLVSYFTDKPFRYFERIHVRTIRPSFATWKPSTFENLRNGVVPDPDGGYLVTPKLHSGVAVQSPAAQPFLGKLFVLLDGGTFSTATDVTAMLRHWKRATFVGEESAGAYEGNTSGLNALVTLPSSKLRLKVQMYGYWNAVSGGEKGRGTQPDHPVEKRAADLLRGVDAPWERALALARGPGGDPRD